MSTTAWVVESGDHEERSICLVAISLEAAVEGLRSKYGDPYVVEWSGLAEDEGRDGSWLIDGWFSAVAGYSTKHVAEFTITPYDLTGT